jgi:hypothetical protein
MFLFLSIATFLITSASASPEVLYDDELSLTSGTFDFVPDNNASASYAVDNFTDLGALHAASVEGGFDFNATDEYYSSFGSFSLNNISDIETSWSGGNSWSIFINGESVSSGLGGNEIENGDTVTFWYCPTNSTTYAPILEEASYVVNITVTPEVLYDDELRLTSGTFDFVPDNNASASYAIDNFTDLGALHAASVDGDFDFNATDEYYSSYGSFSLNNISDIEGSWSGGNSWSIFINGESVSSGLGGNEIENGDTVTFWYCPTNSTTYAPILEEASYVVNIDVSIEDNDDHDDSSNSHSSGGGTGQATIVRNEDETETDEKPVVENNDPETSENDESQDPIDSQEKSPDIIEQENPDVAESTDENQEESQNATPGFESVFAIAGLVLSAVLLMRRND